MRPVKFLVAGGTAAIVEYGVFLLLQATQDGHRPHNLVLSQSISFGCGFAVSFLLNRMWVFRSAGAVSGELARYATLAIINLAASNIALGVLVNVLHLPAPLAKFLVMGMVAAWNYVIFSKLVFAPKTSSSTPPES
jgi:putative flippase GtrA